jgi:hypothetical protein
MTYQLKGNVVLGSNVIGYYDSSIAGFFSNTYISGGYLNVYSSFQGSTYGFSIGGFQASTGYGESFIERYSFAYESGSINYGSLNDRRKSLAGQQSQTHGYASGGISNSPGSTNPVYDIEKFSFTNSSLTGLPVVIDSDFVGVDVTGHSSTSHGYTSATSTPAGPTGPTGIYGISKFTFANDSPDTFVGTLVQGGYNRIGQSSDIKGYVSGGYYLTLPQNAIESFPFSTDSNATDVGDLTQARREGSGQSSSSHGYTSGGRSGSPTDALNTIDKFSFASNNNATDVGDLHVALFASGGTSSVTNGYAHGGETPPNFVQLDTINKFPFATDTNSSSVNNFTNFTSKTAGVQV